MNGETMKRTWTEELSGMIPEALGREIDDQLLETADSWGLHGPFILWRVALATSAALGDRVA